VAPDDWRKVNVQDLLEGKDTVGKKLNGVLGAYCRLPPLLAKQQQSN
jgi:hypothetical protein